MQTALILLIIKTGLLMLLVEENVLSKRKAFVKSQGECGAHGYPIEQNECGAHGYPIEQGDDEYIKVVHKWLFILRALRNNKLYKATLRKML
jgi:hypothetical protein